MLALKNGGSEVDIIKTFGSEVYSTVASVDEIPTSLNDTVLGILHQSWQRYAYFLPDGSKVTLSPVSGHEINNKPLWIVLANTFYNPMRTFSVEPIHAGTYDLDELRSSIAEWVMPDVCAQTQPLGGEGTTLVNWNEPDAGNQTTLLGAEETTLLFSLVKTYDELVLAVRCMNGECDMDLKIAGLSVDFSLESAFRELLGQEGGQQPHPGD